MSGRRTKSDCSAWELLKEDMEPFKSSLDEWGHDYFESIESNPVFRLMMFQQRRANTQSVGFGSRLPVLTGEWGCFGLLILFCFLGYAASLVPIQALGVYVIGLFFCLLLYTILYYNLSRIVRRRKRPVHDYSFVNLPNELMNDLIMAGVDAQTFVIGLCACYKAKRRKLSRSSIIAELLILAVASLVIAQIIHGILVAAMLVMVSSYVLARERLHLKKPHVITAVQCMKFHDRIVRPEDRSAKAIIKNQGCGMVGNVIPMSIILSIIYMVVLAVFNLSTNLELLSTLPVLFVCCAIYGHIMALVATSGVRKESDQEFYKRSLDLVESALDRVRHSEMN